MATKKNRGLGRGLDALFADVATIEAESEATKEISSEANRNMTEDSVIYISLNEIMPNLKQPRKIFNEEKLQELSESIKEHGVIQPLIVRRKEKGYELVAGERRWRAARKAELKEVPCLIRDFDDEQNMLIAIIENMQREDLNPIEEAEGLNQMTLTFGLTQEQISKSVGKSRPYITNALRLLKLPVEVREMISMGEISSGHGRTLISVNDSNTQIDFCHRIMKEGLSVRATEKIVSEFLRPSKIRTPKKVKNPNVIKVEEELKEILGTRIIINQFGEKGKIEISYYSNEELERLIESLKSLR